MEEPIDKALQALDKEVARLAAAMEMLVEGKPQSATTNAQTAIQSLRNKR